MGLEKHIAVLAGDGIGPEVMDQAIKVLKSIADCYGHKFTFEDELVGGIAIDATGNPLPEETINTCKRANAILMGAIGHPKYDNPSFKVRPEQGLLRLRKELGLFCNVRPVTAYDSLIDKSPLKPEVVKGADLVIFRELTGGIYFGESGRSEDRRYAYDKCEYHDWEIERIVRLAFEEATKRRNKITLIDKANVLESSRLWREVFNEVRSEYPDVETNYLYIDNACMQMILNPRQFDVIVTSNMFGDIISDESSVIAGSLGLLPSASLGNKYALFEPVHGSWPEGAGKDIANPLAMILSAAMMLQHFNLAEEAKAIKNAVSVCLEGNFLTGDLNEDNPLKCSEVGDRIRDIVKQGVLQKI